jgi:type II secretory pathway predicted ATPase ExeA
MPQRPDQPALTEPQQAALAKLACGLESLGGIGLLCGPPGVGKTLVLHRLAAAMRCRAGVQRFVDCEPGRVMCGADEPAVLLVDDAHEADDGGLGRLITACRRLGPDVRIVLAGTGRLLTLVARDTRIEQVVRLRATLRPCSAAESATLAADVLEAGNEPLRLAPLSPDVAQTIHEIAGGIPATVVRLAGLARVLAEMHPERPLTVGDVEVIHRRLSLQAA